MKVRFTKRQHYNGTPFEKDSVYDLIEDFGFAKRWLKPTRGGELAEDFDGELAINKHCINFVTEEIPVVEEEIPVVEEEIPVVDEEIPVVEEESKEEIQEEVVAKEEEIVDTKPTKRVRKPRNKKK